MLNLMKASKGPIAQSVINFAQAAIEGKSFEALPSDDNLVTGTKAQPKAITPQWVYYAQLPAS